MTTINYLIKLNNIEIDGYYDKLNKFINEFNSLNDIITTNIDIKVDYIKLNNYTIKERIKNENIENCDISCVTYMSGLFFDKHQFNQDIGNWDISNITNMECIFYNCDKFNQDTSNWDTDNFTNIKYMF